MGGVWDGAARSTVVTGRPSRRCSLSRAGACCRSIQTTWAAALQRHVSARLPLQLHAAASHRHPSSSIFLRPARILIISLPSIFLNTILHYPQPRHLPKCPCGTSLLSPGRLLQFALLSGSKSGFSRRMALRSTTESTCVRVRVVYVYGVYTWWVRAREWACRY